MNDLRLYKYGERKHMQALVHRGQLYLSPATKFQNANLSRGAHDPSELTMEQRLPEGISLEVFDGKTGKLKGTMPVIGRARARGWVETDYFIFCMSYRFGADLFKEFSTSEAKADTCVVITDPDRFINQAGKGIMRALPGWAVDAGSVRYRSPDAFYSLNLPKQEIYYGKTIDYAHQAEVRIVCTPPATVMCLEPLVVEIGSLHGYTYMIGTNVPD